ncbi:MAG: cation:proton antiporter [Planctomycetales bacterium]
MHNLDLIVTLTGGLAAALVLGYITQRLRLSPLVGYLLAGIAVGPATPGFIANKELADQMAELGVILLMFGVGLHFHLSELISVRRIAIPGAIIQSLVATLLGCLLGVAFGWSWSAGLVFGLAISVASTVVLLRVLADNNELHTPIGHIAVGWLVVEDLFTVLVLVLLPVLVHTEGNSFLGVLGILGWSIAKIGVLVATIFYVGGRAIPWFLARIAQTRSRELFTLTILVIALGIAVGAAKIFGVSMALGAFLAGMVVGQSEFSSRAASEALPMRDAFAVLFFVSVGMLFDPWYVIQEPALMIATLSVILIGKPLIACLIVLVLGYPLRAALAIAIVLGQIGEFSFILATLGQELGIFNQVATNAIIASALVSISVNPLLFRLLDPSEKRLLKIPAFSRWVSSFKPKTLSTPHRDHTNKKRAVIVGYGPVGRTLAHLLQLNDIQTTIIEMNLETVRRLRDDGIAAIYGDVTHKETLTEAGVETAVALMLTSSNAQSPEEAVRLARELNPRIRVFVRANYLRELPKLRRVGADVVFSGEGEVALTMTEYLLRQLGASEEQIEREKTRIREELFGTEMAPLELLFPLAPTPDEGISPETP